MVLVELLKSWIQTEVREDIEYQLQREEENDNNFGDVREKGEGRGGDQEKDSGEDGGERWKRNAV